MRKKQFMILFGALLFLVIFMLFDYSETTQGSLPPDDKSCWTIGKNMPTARIEFTSATIGDKIYLIGGYTDKTTDIVEVYDTAKDEWSTLPALPKKLDHLAAAAYNNKIYVVGGFDAESNPSKSLFIYDAVLGEWKEGENMPTARGALTAEFIEGIMYVVGGDADRSIVPGMYHPFGQVATNEAYDPVTDSWIEKTPMPTARHHHVSAVVEDKLYIIGGRYGLGYAQHNFNNTNANEMYDPVENKWVTLKHEPIDRSGASAASVNGSIYVFGGETKNYPSESQHTYADNEKYDPETNSWIAGPSMLTARHGLTADSIDNKIFVIGGGQEPGFTVDDKNEIYNVLGPRNNDNCVSN